MTDRRRRLRVKSDNDSEDYSSESEADQLDIPSNLEQDSQKKKEGEKAETEYESAEEEGEAEVAVAPSDKEEVTEIAVSDANTSGELEAKEEVEAETSNDLIDEEGGEEAIAEPEDVEGEFLDGDLLDATDEECDGEEEEEEEGECVEEERQQGDGEECSPEKELDFDEDRRNPQYIPKKGTFYEHDDRNMGEVPQEKVEKEPVNRDKKKKKLWLDDGRWGHDRYHEEEQTPKSRDELIEVYGYDIRCEDCPPRAGRRRRYGRGPTKYDRSWEDETAYTKEQMYKIFRGGTGEERGGGRRGRGRGGGRMRGGGRGMPRSFNPNISKSDKSRESDDSHPPDHLSQRDFPELGHKDDDVPWDDIPSPPAPPPPQEERNNVLNKKDFPALTTNEIPPRNPLPERSVSPVYYSRPAVVPDDSDTQNFSNSVRSQTFENSKFTSYRSKSPREYERPPREYERPPRQSKNPSFRGSYPGSNRRPPRTMRGRPTTNTGRYNRGGREHYPRSNLAPRLMEKQVRALASEVERLNIDEKDNYVHVGHISSQDQRSPIPKANGVKYPGNMRSSSKTEDASNRPKRYSSLRQRGGPETNSYHPSQTPGVAPPHPPYYENAYQSAIYAQETVVSQPSSQPQTRGSPPVINAPQYQTYNPTPYQEGYAMRLPVNNISNAPRLFPQVTMPATQTIIAPAPVITANPGLITYPSAPPPPAPAYTQFPYQQFPAAPAAPPPVSQTPEMYRSGITYYYPQSQPPPLRHVPQKRPKAAIPIVPPPDTEYHRKMNNEKYSDSEGRRNNSTSEVNSSNGESGLLRTDSSSSQPPLEVES